MSSAPLAAPLTQDLPCMKCSYNLRTLSPAQLCPKCATPVSKSIETQIRNTPIRFRRLAWGAAIMVILPLFPALWFVVSGPVERFLFGGINRPWRAFTALALPLLLAPLFFAAFVLILTSKRPLSRGQRLQYPLAIAVVILGICMQLTFALIDATWHLASFSFVMRHQAHFAIATSLATAALTFLQTTLLIIAWRFMRDLALRTGRHALRVLTDICLPLCAAASVFMGLIHFTGALRAVSAFSRLEPLLDSLASLFPIAMWIHGMVYLSYWCVIALLAWRADRKIRRASAATLSAVS